ncbi:hypothetical protein WA158_000862 [Blastocystis sp. Blastoise]
MIAELIDQYFCGCAINIFKVVGCILTIKFIIYIIQSILFHVLPGKDLKRAYGDWAVVTGSTDGIGLGYAKRLAKRGLNIVLVGRSEEKLASCSQEIIDKYHVEVKTICADMSGDYEELKEQFEKELSSFPTAILVNNVGISYDHAMYLTELPEDRYQMLIKLNVEMTTLITRIVLPGMIERHRGAIINVSSAAGYLYIGDPLYTIYSATKAYVDFFSRSLSLEVKSKGIDVQCHIPYFVPSKLSKIRNSSLFCPSANTFAEAAVNKIGKNAITVVPYWCHALQNWIFNSIPTPLLNMIILSHHKSIRTRALKKKQMKRD